jgi:hypothetical protein
MVPPVGPVGEAKLGLTAAEMGISGVQKGVEAAQGAVNPTDELPEPMDGAELQDPVVEPEVQEQAPPTTVEQMTPSLDETKLPEQTATTEPVLQEQVAEPELQEEAAVEPDTSNEQNGKLNDAVKTIVDEITKQVEENLTTRAAPGDVAPNVETNSNGEAAGNGEVNGNVEAAGEVNGEAAGNVQTNGQDDGFKALTGAVDKLTSDAVTPESGGKRRRNTRRFKLVKNKTKRSTP